MDDDRTQRRLRSSPWWVATVLVISLLALLTLVALGAQGLPGREQRPAPFSIDIDFMVLFKVLLGISAVLLLMIVVMLLLPGGAPIALPERKKSSPFKLLAGVVLFFAIMNLVQLFMDRTQPGVDTRTSETVEESAEPDDATSGSIWGLWVLGGAVLIGVVGIAAATRATHHSSAMDHDVGDTEERKPDSVAGVIESVLLELEGQADARLVVIGAYARMEQALTAAGIPPTQSEAPLEYLARALRHLDVSQSAVVRLTDLFQVARFSTDDIDSRMSDAAKAALAEIRDELSGASA